MAAPFLERLSGTGFGAGLLSAVADQGSASHPYSRSEALLRGADSHRNLADAVHFLSMLHGRLPGIVDLAGGRTTEAPARAWLVAAADAMGVERNFLARLACAVGPVPGTPGRHDSEAVVQGQRNALHTLAQSERRGCAFGAALAFVADWAHVRAVLDHAAHRLDMTPPHFGWADLDAVASVAEAVAGDRAIERAIMFGAQQIAIQHRGLWDLLEARAEARGGA